MYREYLELLDFKKYPLPHDRVIYSIPWKEMSPDAYAKQYRGVCREPLFSWNEKDEQFFRGSDMVVQPLETELEAHLALGRLDNASRRDDDVVLKSYENAMHVFSLLQAPAEREVIWIRDAESDSSEPPDYPLLGYEPAMFGGDWFSALSDCMCFPIWHGTDTEGELFKVHHDNLNQYALFNTPIMARDFLGYYRSFDWTETGDYIITEVRLVNRNV
ncbi:MAG: hypothetical protein ACETWQ_01670 [Phycisphaerae bacterium]